MDNLASLITRRAAAFPTAPFGTNQLHGTLGQAFTTASMLAHRFAAAGLQPGALVAVVGVSNASFMAIWLAGQLAGFQCALLNPLYPDELIAQMLEDLAPAAVITIGRDLTVVPAAAAVVINADRAWQGELEFIRGGVEDACAPAMPGNAAGLSRARTDIACLMHTSGTTGKPKFCALSHDYFLRLGRFMADSLGIVPGDTVYAPLPMFHINPLGYGVVGALVGGAGVLGSDRFSASAFWATVKLHRITSLILHLPPVKILQASTKPEDASGHQVRSAFCAPTSFLEAFGIPLGMVGYGSTEAGGMCTGKFLRQGDRTHAVEDQTSWCGRAREDVEWDLSAEGEILVRGRHPGALFSGYLRDGVLAPSLDDDRWFHTGDRGRRDDQGGLVFIERMSEAIRVNGEYVPIDYVEGRLQSEARLKDFALWRKPDSVSGHRVVLYIEGPMVAQELISAVFADLPKFMRPVEIIRIAKLPRDTGVGKVQRRRLPEAFVLERSAS